MYDDDDDSPYMFQPNLTNRNKYCFERLSEICNVIVMLIIPRQADYVCISQRRIMTRASPDF